MSRTPFLALAALLAIAPAAGAQQQTPVVPTAAPSAPPAPELGAPAPDFTAQWADSSGPRATPVKLSELRGKVVVLAFYPKDRTQGCTAEMTKFRDEYQALFGSDVVVLPISADSIPSHVSWASEMKFPFALVSDPSFTVADAYGSHVPGRATTGRTVFVIGKDGRIAWREMRFNALSEDAYSALKDAVAKAR
jgi:thioredoxin-dependent peroxiredoxin